VVYYTAYHLHYTLILTSSCGDVQDAAWVTGQEEIHKHNTRGIGVIFLETVFCPYNSSHFACLHLHTYTYPVHSL
jgi:hypothetical protein